MHYLQPNTSVGIQEVIVIFMPEERAQAERRHKRDKTTPERQPSNCETSSRGRHSWTWTLTLLLRTDKVVSVLEIIMSFTVSTTVNEVQARGWTHTLRATTRRLNAVIVLLPTVASPLLPSPHDPPHPRWPPRLELIELQSSQA